jgi:hypothetical protein
VAPERAERPGASGGASDPAALRRGAPLIAVTDHAVERYRQRVRGSLDAAREITARVGAAWAAGRVADEPPAGATGTRGSVYVRDRDIVFICRHDRPRGELVVVTLWEEGAGAAVPRRFTDALEPRRRRGSGTAS